MRLFKIHRLDKVREFTLFSPLSCVLCLVAEWRPTLCDPMDCSLSGCSVHADSPGKNTGVGWHAVLQGIFPTQKDEPGSPALQVDSLPAELPGKPLLCFAPPNPRTIPVLITYVTFVLVYPNANAFSRILLLHVMYFKHN